MEKVILLGATGRMGREVMKASFQECFWITAGIDRKGGSVDGVPLYRSVATCFKEMGQEADLVIDFSSAELTDELLQFAVKERLPVVLATTGQTKEQQDRILEASKEIPIFASCNMSYGIGLFTTAVKGLAEKLCHKMDTEIIEFHHRYKKDAPSGTALMLGEEISKASGIPFELVCGRGLADGVRQSTQLGISSVRGGNTVGEHQVIFSGEDEVITLTHRVENRRTFAYGALKAGRFLLSCPPGLYGWQDFLGKLQ